MEESITLTSESDNLYKNLFEKNPACMYIFDPDTYQILDANETVLNSYGYSKEEFLKMTLADFRPKEDADKLKTAVDNLLEDFTTGIWRHKKKNSEVIHVEIKAVKISFKGKTAILSMPEDITERVKREEEILKLNANLLVLNEDLRKNVKSVSKLNEELQLKEVRLKAAQEAGKIGCWEYDFRSELYYISDELYEIFGIPYIEGPVERSVLTPKVHSDDLSIVREAVRRAKTSGEFPDYTYRILGENDEIKYIYTKGEVIKGEDGAPEKIFGISMDITEREKDRQALLQQSNNVKIILRSITDIFYIVDRDYTLLFANEAVEKLTGLSQKELIGSNVWKIFEGANLDLPRKEFEKTLKENKASQFDMNYLEMTFRVFLYPSEIGLAVSGKDVTDHMKTQNELARQLNNIEIILKSITEPFFILDNSYDILFANEAFAELTDHHLTELKGKKIWPIFLHRNQDFTNLRRGLEKALKTKISNDLEFNYNSKTFYTHIFPSQLGLAVSCTDITSRKQAEMELKLNTKFIKEISETMPGVIFQTEYDKDKKPRFNYISRKIEEFTGYTAEEMLEDYYRHVSCIHKDDLHHFLNAREGISDQKSVSIKYRYINHKTGAVRTVRITLMPTKLASGHYIRNGILLDVTEIENYYNELEKSNQRYEYISKASNETIWDMDVRTSIVSLGGSYKEMYGTSFPDNQINAYEAERYIHPDDFPVMLNRMAEAISKRENFLEQRYKMCRADGSIIYVYERGYIFYEEGTSNPIRILGTMQDVTKLHLAEIEKEKIIAELEKSNQRYEFVSKAANETIWDLDITANIITLGGAYKEMYGISFPDNKCTPQVMSRFTHPDDLDAKVKSIHETVDNFRHFWEHSYRVIRDDGSIMYVHDRGYVIYDDAKMPVRVVGTAQDITALKLAEKEKEKIISDLVKKNSALEQFTYMVSHNLRAPVANILGLSAIIEEENAESGTKNELNGLIVKASERLDEVVKDMNEILDLQKNFSEDKTEILFEKLLYEIVSSKEFSIAKSKIKFNCDFEKAKSFYGVKSSMQSIFRNLISNGIKFRKDEDAFIKICSFEDDEHIYLSFEDNGIGIDLNKNRQKMFVLYNRFHLDKEGKGSGLFMVKTQVENMGGEIFVESEVNKGTKFLIKFKK